MAWTSSGPNSLKIGAETSGGKDTNSIAAFCFAERFEICTHLYLFLFNYLSI
jgi:hypothetical protein